MGLLGHMFLLEFVPAAASLCDSNCPAGVQVWFGARRSLVALFNRTTAAYTICWGWCTNFGIMVIMVINGIECIARTPCQTGLDRRCITTGSWEDDQVCGTLAEHKAGVHLQRSCFRSRCNTSFYLQGPGTWHKMTDNTPDPSKATRKPHHCCYH
jgi:hypothetical protein